MLASFSKHRRASCRCSFLIANKKLSLISSMRSTLPGFPTFGMTRGESMPTMSSFGQYWMDRRECYLRSDWRWYARFLWLSVSTSLCSRPCETGTYCCRRAGDKYAVNSHGTRHNQSALYCEVCSLKSKNSKNSRKITCSNSNLTADVPNSLRSASQEVLSQPGNAQPARKCLANRYVELAWARSVYTVTRGLLAATNFSKYARILWLKIYAPNQHSDNDWDRKHLTVM